MTIIIPGEEQEQRELQDKKFFDQYLDHSWVNQAWLGLGNTSHIKLNNPILHRTKEDIENPGIHILRTMRKPSYLAFAAKTLLGINLLPMQAVVLEELWRRPFPMLVASRGWGKSWLLAVYSVLKCVLSTNTKVVIAGAAFRQSKFVFEYAENIWNNADILRSICDNHSGPRRENDRCTLHINENTITAIPIGCLSGDTLITTDIGVRTLSELNNTDKYNKILSNNKYNSIGYFFDNGIKQVKKITTKIGYSYTGTHNHRMKIVRDNKIIWCRTDEMKIGDFVLINKSADNWFLSTFSCSKDEAYVLGAMIGDGSYVNKYYLQFTNVDREIIDYVNNILGVHSKNKDNLHFQYLGKDRVKKWLDFWGLEKTYTQNKSLPNTILSANKENIAACLSGLFDTDGGIQLTEAKGGLSCCVSFFNTSKKLVNQIRYLLLKFGIISSLDCRNGRKSPRSNNICLPSYTIRINGKYAKIFYKEIGFRLSRKQELLQYYIEEEKGRSSINSDIMPIDRKLLLKICDEYSLGQDYSRSRVEARKKIVREYLVKFIQRCKKKKVKQELIDQLEIFTNENYYFDKIKSIEDAGEINTYDINVPENNEYNAEGFYSHNSGDKIRGLRAKIVIAEEFASHSPDIYETVIAGFAAVSADPVINVQEYYRKEAMENLGLWTDELQSNYLTKDSNQAIISGTAYYAFNHFYDYWRRYKAIIESGGNKTKLEQALGGEVPPGFNWQDYSIIRIPYELIPKGFMDEKIVARAKATVHSGSYLCEYGACFSLDSDGFFKRSLIESCVTSDIHRINLPKSGNPVFEASLRGDPNKKYVFGIDPASEHDNFSIVILELNEDHTRVVHCWTTNRPNFKKRMSLGATNEHDFYKYAARKIRDLMTVFPCVKIAMDSQGGGVSVAEALQDPGNLKHGEKPIYPTIDPEKEKETDDKPGLHILELCNFAKYDWVRDANHGLRKDLEDKCLLFPRFDSISLGLAADRDADIRDGIKKTGMGKALDFIDTFEDCIMEIEELKNEMATITVTVTGTGVNARERWDVPEIKLPNNRKGRMRKDRYSALLMANMVARQMVRAEAPLQYRVIGGFSKDIVNKKSKNGENQPLYIGPDWFVNGGTKNIGLVTRRRD